MASVNWKFPPLFSDDYFNHLRNSLSKQKSSYIGQLFLDPQNYSKEIEALRVLYVRSEIDLTPSSIVLNAQKYKLPHLGRSFFGDASLESVSSLLGIPYSFVKRRVGAQNNLGHIVQRLFHLPLVASLQGYPKTNECLEDILGFKIQRVAHNISYRKFFRNQKPNQLNLFSKTNSSFVLPLEEGVSLYSRPDFLIVGTNNNQSIQILGESKNLLTYDSRVFRELEKYSAEHKNDTIHTNILFLNAHPEIVSQVGTTLDSELNSWRLVSLRDYEEVYRTAVTEIDPSFFAVGNHNLLLNNTDLSTQAGAKKKLLDIFYRALYKPHTFLQQKNTFITRHSLSALGTIGKNLQSKKRLHKRTHRISKRTEIPLDLSTPLGRYFQEGLEKIIALINSPLKRELFLDSLPRYVPMDIEHTGSYNSGGYPSVIGLLKLKRHASGINASLVQHTPNGPLDAPNRTYSALHEIKHTHPTAPHVVTFNGSRADMRWLFEYAAMHEIRNRRFPGEENGVIYETDLFVPDRTFDFSFAVAVALKKYETNFINSELLRALRKNDIGSRRCITNAQEFAKTGEARSIEQVKEHNGIDIISTALMFYRELLLTSLDVIDNEGYLQQRIRRSLNKPDHHHLGKFNLITKLYGPTFSVYDFNKQLSKKMRPPLIVQYSRIPSDDRLGFYSPEVDMFKNYLDRSGGIGFSKIPFAQESPRVCIAQYLSAHPDYIYGHRMTRRERVKGRKITCQDV